MLITECLCCGEQWRTSGPGIDPDCIDICPNCGANPEDHVILEDTPIPGIECYA